jgi:hypothetical protein
MLGVLVVVGITQPRGTSIIVWCSLYLVTAVFFDGLVILTLVYQYTVLAETILGVSAGAATGLAIHVAHHILEERRSTKSSSSEKMKSQW